MLNGKLAVFWCFLAHACDDITVELNAVELKTIVGSKIGLLQNIQ